MTLYQTELASKYRVYFNDIETNNIKKALNDDISIRNINLCYYIEHELPKEYEDLKDKSIMVLNIFYDGRYISALILIQNIKLDFKKPKQPNTMFKVTAAIFKRKDDFDKWIKGKDYGYKVLSTSTNSFNVILFNVKAYDEMSLSRYGAQIEKRCGIVEYIIYKAADKIKEQIKCLNWKKALLS